MKCVQGVLSVVDCSPGEEPGTCGWSAESGAYACGGSGPDPSGANAPDCDLNPGPDIEEDPLPPVCQGVPWAGCCKSSKLVWCDGAAIHSIECGAACGWDWKKGYYDCGGEGPDPSGEYGLVCPDIVEEEEEEPTQTPVCTNGVLVATDCQGIEWEGCCSDDGALLFCEKGQKLCLMDCTLLLEPLNTCGWQQEGGGYFDCGGKGSDPLGVHPVQCPPVEIDPETRTPDPTPVWPKCPGVPDSGCCLDGVLLWCDQGKTLDFDCSSLAGDPVFGGHVYCGTNPATGKADCLKKADPSPPECTFGSEEEPPPESSGPETVDSVEAVAEAQDNVTAEPVSEEVLTETITEHVAGDIQSDGPSWGVVIVPPPPKSDGCTAGTHPTSNALLSLLLLLLGMASAKSWAEIENRKSKIENRQSLTSS